MPEDRKATRPALSRRSLVRYGAVGRGVAVVGGGAVVMANRPAISGRQQGLARIADWTADNIPSLQGRTALVTGGNGYPEEDRSGLGYHTALELARAGADVIIASRRKNRGEEALRRIKASVPGAAIRFEVLDLSDLDSVAHFAERMRAGRSSLDILVNNAGVMGRKRREVSVNGFERVFATNTLGHFVLTAHLMPLLRAGQTPRIVWLSSLRAFGGTINFADLQGEKNYDYSAAYDHTKLANLMLAFELHKRSKAANWGVASIAVHPGVARTNIIIDGPGLDSRDGSNFTNLSFMFGPPAIGALPTLYAATSPEALAGAYYGPNGVMETGGLPGWAQIPEKAENGSVAAALWSKLEQLGRVEFASFL